MNKTKKDKKPLKPTYITKARADMSYIQAEASPFLTCDNCKAPLTIRSCLRHALFKKRGSKYSVPCKECGHLNVRIKGALSMELNTRWVD